ncbi:MAG: hypothetical protein ACKVP0_09575 [Pirellulaceae bacterium]
MRSRHNDVPSIQTFAVLNFILAAFCLMWLMFLLAILVFGVTLSGDQGEELLHGALGCFVLASPALAGLPLYLAAGFGLKRRTVWGFFCHCGGALLAALSCIGMIYTVIALVGALQRDFYAAFFPSTDD